MPPKQNKKVKTKLGTREQAIKQILRGEAERNALLRSTEVMSGSTSHLTDSPAFDILKTVQNTSILLHAHIDLIMMKRDLYEKMKDGFERHSMSNPFLEFGHTSTSASLHFLKLIDQGLHIVENDFSMMIDSLDENKEECRSNQMNLFVASSVLLTAIIGGFLVKRFLW